jgi:hypothetical protein
MGKFEAASGNRTLRGNSLDLRAYRMLGPPSVFICRYAFLRTILIFVPKRGQKAQIHD